MLHGHVHQTDPDHTSMQAPFVLMLVRGLLKCAHIIYNYVNVTNAPYTHGWIIQNSKSTIKSVPVLTSGTVLVYSVVVCFNNNDNNLCLVRPSAIIL